jgi:hypothetical protein
MSTLSEQSRTLSRPRRLPADLLLRNMWAGLAITVMWLAVLFDALFGPDIVSTSGGGTNTTTIPSAVAVALFAWLATKTVAKHGIRRSDNDAD